MVVPSRVGKRYTIVIPREVRHKVPIREGETILWSIEGDRIILKPTSFKRLAGIVTKSQLVKTRWIEESLEKELSEEVSEATE